MKNDSKFDIRMLQVLLVGASILFVSACYNQQYKNGEETEAGFNEAVFNSSNEEQEAKFLVDVAESNLQEIQLAQLVQRNNMTECVKELAEMMEEEHTSMLSTLTSLANKKYISLPQFTNDKSKKIYEKLKEKSGIDVDKAYSDLMVGSHKDAIALFEKGIKETNDPDIKQWAITTKRSLEIHLNHSIACKKRCDKM